MRRAQWFAAAGLTVALLAGVPDARAKDDAPAVVRYLASPRYLLELPGLPEASDLSRGESVLATLEELAQRLDAEMVAADVVRRSVLPKKADVERFANDGAERLAEAPRPRGTGKAPMRVRLARTRDEIVAACGGISTTVNSQGTAFYRDAETALLGVVASDDDPVKTATLLHWGTLQLLHDRIGLYYKRTGEPKGACVPEGFAHFMRWSHLDEYGGFPPELGGIGEKYGDDVRARAAADAPAGAFPSLEDLFAATPADFDRDGARLYGPAVLLVEFLWETSPETRADFLRALKTMAGSSSPVAAFELGVVVKALHRRYKDAATLEAAFRSYVTEQSAAVNARKSGTK